MKNLIAIISFLISFAAVTSAQDTALRDPWKYNRLGNELYRKKNFTAAENRYREAVQHDTSKSVSNYNLGSALYRQKKYDEAEKAFANSLDMKDPDSLAKGWHNLGNSLFQQQKYEESINAYKEALRNNPADEHARYNLAMAQKMLKARQPPQDKQSGQECDNSGQNQSNNQSNNQTDNQNSGSPQENDSQQPQNQNPQQQSMSKEDAKKLLNSLKNSEQETRKRMNPGGSGNPSRRSKEKDW